MDFLRIHTDFDLLIYVREARRKKGLPVYYYEEEVKSGLLNKNIFCVRNNQTYKIKSVKKCWKFGYYIKLEVHNNNQYLEVFFVNESSIDEEVISKNISDMSNFFILD